MSNNNNYRNVLRTCAQSLMELVNQLPAGQSSVQPSTSSNSTIHTPPTPTSISSNSLSSGSRGRNSFQSSSSSSFSEHQRLFRGHQGRSRGGRRQSHPYMRKLSLNFVCLSSITASYIPDTAEKISLTVAGLGEKRIVFDDSDDNCSFDRVIKSSFPQLSSTGGYEMLRVSHRYSKSLKLVPPPPNGYNVQYLKSIFGQSKAYIRPLQRDAIINVGEVVSMLICMVVSKALIGN